MSFDGATGRLFLDRRLDGLTVFDIDTHSATTVENSKGANGALLVPEFNRVYVACTDGAVLALDLATLRPIERFNPSSNRKRRTVTAPSEKSPPGPWRA